MGVSVPHTWIFLLTNLFMCVCIYIQKLQFACSCGVGVSSHVRYSYRGIILSRDDTEKNCFFS